MSLSGPLPSATYAGQFTPYYAARDAGGQLVGVQSLNTLIGILAIKGDTSIGVTTPGLGAIQISTAGLPQVPSSVTATGAVVGATVTATGALAGASAAIAGSVSAASAAIVGGLTAGSATVTASVNAASVAASGLITSSNTNGPWRYWNSSGQVGAGQPSLTTFFDFASATPYGSTTPEVATPGLYMITFYGNTGPGTGTSTTIPPSINNGQAGMFLANWDGTTMYSFRTAPNGNIVGPYDPVIAGEGLIFYKAGPGLIQVARNTAPSVSACSFYAQVFRII